MATEYTRTNPVAFDDIQALARFGHGHLGDSRLLLLRIADRAAAGRWLAGAAISSAEDTTTRPVSAMQIAFTKHGLRALGLADAVIAQFADEFTTGLAGDESRSRRLGDVGTSAPSRWRWSDADSTAIDAVLLLYAQRGALSALTQRVLDTDFAEGFGVQNELPTDALQPREPFGFVDGISQPTIDWHQRQRTDTHARHRYSNLLAPGEVVLGYPNEYGQLTRSPLIDPADDPLADSLPHARNDETLRDFGMNGSFLVMRQLRQHVGSFWRFLDETCSGHPEARDALAEHMVGRRRDGTPLMTATTEVIPGIPSDHRHNRFDYEDDLHGLQCPVSAHIRRSNPRTGDLPPGPSAPLQRLLRTLGFKRRSPYEDLVASSRYHRLLRRGRTFGGPILSPEDALALGDDGVERGLHFICLCGSLRRQFEFVQNAWSVSTSFAGLQEQADPLLGTRESRIDGSPGDRFIHADERGTAQRIAALPRFVDVIGGAYCFLPGLSAIRYLGATAQEHRLL